MISIATFLTVFSLAHAGYSGSETGTTNVLGASAPGGGAGSAGSGASAGAGSGSFAGPFPPGQFPPVPNFDFQTFLNSYFDSLKKYHEEFAASKPRSYSYSYTYSSPNSLAKAESSLKRNPKGRKRFPQNAGAGYGFPGGFPAFAGIPQGFAQGGQGQGQGSYGGGFGGSYGGSYGGPADGGAAASASIGPDGVHQTAQVFPENPNSPNVDTRFGGGQGEPGSYSVFTSSVSGSSDVNGKKTGFHKAQTTVNDNGKITTYTSSNP